MIMNVEYIWLTWLNEMQIISYCYVQIKVPPPSANDLNQLIYSRLPRPIPAPEIFTLAPPHPAPPRRFWPLPCPGNWNHGQILCQKAYYFRLASVHYVKAIKRPGVHLTLHLIKCDSKIILGTEKFNLSHFHYYGSYLVLKTPRKQIPHFGSLWQIVIDVTHEPDSSKSNHLPFYFFTGPFSTVPHLLLWISI